MREVHKHFLSNVKQQVVFPSNLIRHLTTTKRITYFTMRIENLQFLSCMHNIKSYKDVPSQLTVPKSSPKRCPFYYRGLECKSRKSRNTWSNK